MSRSAPAATRDSATPPRQPRLDGIRGIAILAVLLFHGFYTMASGMSAAGAASPFWDLLSGGWLGVDLFFVLSGFLITGILIRSRQRGHYFQRFYISRAFRIFPAYFAVLGFVMFVYPAFNARLAHSDFNSWWPSLLLFVTNWVIAFSGAGPLWPGLDHVWSLHVEEQFYLLWPLLVWLTPPRHTLRLCAAFWIFAVACKLVAVKLGASWLFLYVATITHMDGLAAGAFIAALLAQAGPPRWPRLVAAAGIAAMLGLALMFIHDHSLVLGSRRNVAIATTLVGVTTAALIHSVQARPTAAGLPAVLEHRWLIYLGQRSYSLYLVHWLLYWQVRELIEPAVPPGWSADTVIFLIGATTIVASLLIAEGMFLAIERPFLKWKAPWLRRYPATVA